MDLSERALQRLHVPLQAAVGPARGSGQAGFFQVFFMRSLRLPSMMLGCRRDGTAPVHGPRSVQLSSAGVHGHDLSKGARSHRFVVLAYNHAVSSF